MSDDAEFDRGGGNAFADLPLHKRLEQAVAEDAKKPPKERFQALVDRGAIDEDGCVLLRSPLTEGDG